MCMDVVIFQTKKMLCIWATLPIVALLYQKPETKAIMQMVVTIAQMNVIQDN